MKWLHKPLLMMKRPNFMQVILAHRSENNNNAVLVTQTIGKMRCGWWCSYWTEMKLQHGQPNEIVVHPIREEVKNEILYSLYW